MAHSDGMLIKRAAAEAGAADDKKERARRQQEAQKAFFRVAVRSPTPDTSK